MVRPLMVEARSGFRIWLRYADGAEGEVDLSHLAGRGVFGAWRQRSFFECVRVTEYDAIAWGEEIELCPDALYMRLTGKSVAEIMPEVQRGIAHTAKGMTDKEVGMAAGSGG